MVPKYVDNGEMKPVHQTVELQTCQTICLGFQQPSVRCFVHFFTMHVPQMHLMLMEDLTLVPLHIISVSFLTAFLILGSVC